MRYEEQILGGIVFVVEVEGSLRLHLGTSLIDEDMEAKRELDTGRTHLNLPQGC